MVLAVDKLIMSLLGENGMLSSAYIQLMVIVMYWICGLMIGWDVDENVSCEIHTDN